MVATMKQVLTILFVLIVVSTQATTWRVGATKSIQHIRVALQKAHQGDTILIDPGVYREEQLIIDKKIFFKGINFPVIEGESKYEILTIRCDGVIVEGLHFKHSGRSSYNDLAAVRITDCRYVIIRNNKVSFSYFGIYSQHTTACSILNNILYSDAKDEISSGNGIHCWKSDSLHIEGNDITGHRDGIYFEFVSNSVITRNTSHLNVRYGLHFMFSSNNTYLSNIFRDNGAGVAVMYSKGIRMLQNTFSDNWGSAAYGILMKDITDSHVEGNLFKGNTVGIMMEGTSRIMILQNRFERNGWAMKIQASCMDNTITKNNFKSNSFDMATNGELVLNIFHQNYWDKYEGYDLNRNGIGDVPYHPVSMFSMITERNPSSMMLFHSMIVRLLDQAEKMLPVLTPADLKDDEPLMKPLNLK